MKSSLCHVSMLVVFLNFDLYHVATSMSHITTLVCFFELVMLLPFCSFFLSIFYSFNSILALHQKMKIMFGLVLLVHQTETLLNQVSILCGFSNRPSKVYA